MLMKKRNGSLARYAAGAAGAALLLPLPALAAKMIAPSEGRGAAPRMDRTITVTGEGRVAATPDIAVSQVGVQAVAKTLAAANQEANTTMRKVLDVLKGEGIADHDIQTTSYSVNIERRFDPQTGAAGEITGFRVANQVQVKFRDLKKVGAVLDRVIAAGANDIYGVSFTVDDPSAVRARARVAAMTDAASKATQLARAGHAAVAQVQQITDLSDGPVTLTRLEATRADKSVPIEAGELEFVERVQVVYSLQ